MCGGRLRDSSVTAWHCHICHQERVTALREDLVASSGDLAGPGSFHHVAPGLLWHLQPRLGAEGTGLGAQESRPCAGVATKPSHLCLCSPCRPELRDRGSCFYGLFLGNGARRGCFGWRFTRDWEEVGPLNPIPEQTAPRAGCALRKEKGDGEGAGQGGRVISRELIFSP